MLMCAGGYGVAYAHTDEHEAQQDVSVVQEEAEVLRLERVISLMQQVIILLTTLKTMTPVSETSMLVPTQGAGSVDEMDVHHTEHSGDEEDETTEVSEEEVLMIELEPHNGRTHAHVRYVDKPEEMFFIEPSLSDEDGIVSALVLRTGLSADVVRGALKYME